MNGSSTRTARQIADLHTGRRTRPLPKKHLLMIDQPNRDFATELAAVEQALRAECGVVVYFTRLVEQKAMPSEQDLQARLPLRVTAEFADGSILGMTTCPQ